MNMRTLILALGIMLTAPSVFAIGPTYEGKSIQGWVWVPTVSSTQSARMSGTFNVRFNPRPGHERSWIDAYYYVGGAAYLQAYDATTGNRFFCYVLPSDYYYEEFTALISSLSDGAGIDVKSPVGSNKCATSGTRFDMSTDYQN